MLIDCFDVFAARPVAETCCRKMKAVDSECGLGEEKEQERKG